MMVKKFKAGLNMQSLRKGLVMYSVVVFAVMFIAQAAILFSQPADADVIDTGFTCTGAAGSGASCNSIVPYNPIEGHMFGCYNKGSGFKCYQVPTNSIQGLPGCYLASNGTWGACGCNIAQCQAQCEQQYAGQPGHHTYTSICTNCGQKFTCGCDISVIPTVTPTPPTPTPTPQGCPSTQARFLVGDRGLVSSGNYNLNEIPPFHYSVLVNQDVNQFFQGNVTITGPFGTQSHNNGNTRNVPTPWNSGTYTLTARYNGEVCDTAQVSLFESHTPTPSPSPSVSPSPSPTATATPTVSPSPSPSPSPTPIPSNVTVTKTALNEGPVQIGSNVVFRIDIRNIGQTTVTAINFRDQYNSSRLDFRRIYLNNGNTVTNEFSIDENLGIIRHEDLTQDFGDLAPGATMTFFFEFRALVATNRTCNDVFIIPSGGKGEISARDCVEIKETPPPTDL